MFHSKLASRSAAPHRTLLDDASNCKIQTAYLSCSNSTPCLTVARFLIAFQVGMESPVFAERLMTPTADGRGGVAVVNPPNGGFFVADRCAQSDIRLGERQLHRDHRSTPLMHRPRRFSVGGDSKRSDLNV